MKANAQKYELVARPKTDRVHLLSNIVKCPVCGAGMYGNKSIKKRPDGTKYKDFYYYGCKHRNMQRGYKCDYRKQIQEEVLDAAVAEVVSKLVSNPRFAAMMQEKINMKVDTTAIEQEIAAYEKQLRQHYSTKSRLMEEIDSLDPDDRHFIARKSDLDDRLYKMYDKIEEVENGLMDARAKKQAIEADKITGDNIYKILICFDKLYATMTEAERRRLVEILIDEVQIYPERQPNGQWLKSVRFKLPIIDHDLELSLDNKDRVETVCLLVLRNPVTHINIDVDVEEMVQDKRGMATYGQIKEYVLEHSGLKVSSLYIAQVKQKHGIIERENYNKPKSDDARQPQCPLEKERAITEALKHFGML